jgi:hypothetical protein
VIEDPVFPPASGHFLVTGIHTYADAGVNGGVGHFTVSTTVVDGDGTTAVTINNTANVSDVPIILTGILNPASDSGKSHFDAITNVAQPNFYGTSEAFSDIQLFANGVLVGQTQAGSDGSWSITSNHLADGSYAISATAIDQFGKTTTVSPTQILPNATQGLLVIDTVGPRVTAASLNRLNSTVTFTFQDFQQNGVTPGGSGLLVQSLSDAANYSLNRVHKRPPGKFIVTSLSVIPGAGPASQNVTVVFNNGAFLRGGFFQIIARSANDVGAAGIQDVAGNALDGEFYGPASASGNGVPGGSFVANVTAIHNGNSGPITIIGFPHPNDPAGQFKNTHGKTDPSAPLKPVVGKQPLANHIGTTHRKTDPSAPLKPVVGKQPLANHIGTTHRKTDPSAPLKNVAHKHPRANHKGPSPRTTTPAPAQTPVTPTPVSPTPVTPTSGSDPNPVTPPSIPVTPAPAPPPVAAPRGPLHLKKKPVAVLRNTTTHTVVSHPKITKNTVVSRP